jgi:hypothetical protein
MPPDAALWLGALACFAIGTLQLPLRVNLVALGLALATLTVLTP